MERVLLLLFCLVLSSVVSSSDPMFEEDPTEIVDGVPRDDEPFPAATGDFETYEDRPYGTEGDEKVTDRRTDRLFLVNGQTFREEKGQLPVYSRETRSEDRVRDKAEDPAPYGWIKHPFSWCTIAGRELISKDTNNPIDFIECQNRCIETPGCTAIEFWTTYNYACFVCTNTDLIEPYTNERDLAYPVHVWVQQPYPETPYPTTLPPYTYTSPSRGNNTPVFHPEINVTCGQNAMYISIPKSLLPGIDREHIRLSDLSCGATETRDSFILHTALTECNTKSRHTSRFVSYMNKVEEIPIGPHQIITRIREVEIPFSCYYSNTGVVSAVGIKVESRKVMFSSRGLGRFVLSLEIFTDAGFQNQIRKRSFPAVVSLRQILYVKVSVVSDDSRLAILAEDCFATPNPSPNNPEWKYTFIENGCATDPTVHFLSSDDSRMQKFDIEAFTFIGDHSFVYMHCKVRICNASDSTSRCAQGCIQQQRGKRSLMVPETKDEAAYLAEGPFMLEENDETQVDETMKKTTDEEKRAKYPTLVTAAMAVVAVACVLGVSYVALRQRKQKVLRDYQRLTIPSDE